MFSDIINTRLLNVLTCIWKPQMAIFIILLFQHNYLMPTPRGVLFYGPPGCGKTLVARALANECSKGGKKVAFFMRKGADCLSKWVGESERQLRLLFDQVYTGRERDTLLSLSLYHSVPHSVTLFLLSHSLTHSLFLSPPQSLPTLLLPSLTRSLTQSLTHSLTNLLSSLLPYSLPPSLTPSLPPSLAPSVKLFTPSFSLTHYLPPPPSLTGLSDETINHLLR